MVLGLLQYGGLKEPAGGAEFKTVKIAAVLSCGRLPEVDILIVDTSEVPV